LLELRAVNGAEIASLQSIGQQRKCRPDRVRPVNSRDDRSETSKPRERSLVLHSGAHQKWCLPKPSASSLSVRGGWPTHSSRFL